MKRRFKYLFLIMVLPLIFLTGCSKKNNNFKQSTTPTIFFHGLGSSYHAQQHMVHAAEKAGVTNQVIRANVDINGKVTLIGEWKKNAINPICEVNYQNNHNLNYELYGQYATNVVKALQKRYGIKKMNMVGHSAGNMSIIYYMLKNGKNKKMPQLQKQVDIAGPFAGLSFDWVPLDVLEPSGMKLNSEGKPNKINPTYREMMGVRKTYPKNQVEVLNMVGDIGHHTDGRVSNASTLALKYLVADRAKSYRVVNFSGPNAQHSKLHRNNKVDKVLINFLWKK